MRECTDVAFVVVLLSWLRSEDPEREWEEREHSPLPLVLSSPEMDPVDPGRVMVTGIREDELVLGKDKCGASVLREEPSVRGSLDSGLPRSKL